MTGRVGRAWKVSIPPGSPSDWSATVASYLVNVVGAHPFWTWWAVSVVSLRQIEGVAPAHKSYPEAEYEFLIVTINPEHPPDPDAVGDGYRFLMPPDVVEQFHGLNDEEVAKLCMMSASIIVQGKASPDQDWRSWWKAAIPNTVKHIALGGHPTEMA